MKKLVAILMLCMAILGTGLSADAKTASKKSGSSANSGIKFGQMYDGYPNIGGHTYSGTLQGIKMTVKFEPLNGDMGYVHIKATYRGQSEEEYNCWYYEGRGEIMFYMDGGSECYYQIRDGGKELYNSEANFTLKAIK